MFNKGDVLILLFQGDILSICVFNEQIDTNMFSTTQKYNFIQGRLEKSESEDALYRYSFGSYGLATQEQIKYYETKYQLCLTKETY